MDRIAVVKNNVKYASWISMVNACQSKKGIAYCDKLFYIEEQLKEISKDERYRKRLEQEKPVIDEFWKWIYDTEPIVLPKTKLGKAIAYTINQKTYMENYLKDGRCA